MKPSFRNPLLRTLFITTLTLLGCSSLAYSADLYWDANGETAAVGGTGNWSATAWRDGSVTGTLGTWVDGNRPVFGTTLGIVTLDQNVAADGINFAVNNSEIRGSGTNAITFSGGTITSATAGHDITALLAGSVIFNPTTGSLSSATTVNVKANNSGLTSVELNATGAAPANANIIIDDAGAFGPGGGTPSAVTLTNGILNIGALTNEVIGVATGSGGGLNLNAWTTTLAGGTIRSRTGANTWNGPTILTANSGLMTRGVSDVMLTFSSTGTINLNSFTLTSSSDFGASGIKLQGNITGTGKIATGNFNGGGSINAAGATVLSGTNDYSGGTDVNFGSLIFLNTASKPTSGAVTVAAGSTLGLGVGASPAYFTDTEIDALFAGTLANVTLNATSNVGIDTTAGDYTYGGTTSGSITYGLAKFGPNKLTLSGSNAYTGPTTVFGGSLSLSGIGTFGSGALTLNGGTVDLGGQSISIGALSVLRAATSGQTITAGSLTTSGTAANSYAVSNSTGNAIIAAGLLENSTAGLTKTGNGTAPLSGANTYTGGTTVSAGGITFLNTSALPASGTVTAVAAATVGLGVGASPTYFTAADVAALFAGTLTNVAGTNAYTVGIDTSAGDFTYPTDLGTSSRALTKLGTNALTLSGNNTFDKLITVNEGTLKAGISTAFNNTGTLAVLPGATFDLNGFDAKFVSMTSNTGTVTTAGAGSGTDTLTLSASNLDNGIGNLFTDNGTRKLKLDFTALAGAARQATTNINNTYSGGLVLGNLMRVLVPAGTVGTPGAIVSGGFGRGPVTINGGTSNANGAQIYFNGGNRTLVNDVIVNGNAGNGSRAGSFRISYSGSVISGNIDANAVDAHLGADGAVGTSLALTGKLTGLKGFRFFTSSGANAWTATLNNATASPNDYVGNTIVDNSSVTLVLGAANQIPDGVGKGNLLVNFGKFDLAGYSETVNGLTGGATTTIDNLTAANLTNILTVGGATPGTTFSGVIQNTTGELSIIKTGTGTQTFAGANAYAGATTVDGGTLLINGDQTLAPGAVQVNAATLGGTGTVGGAVTVALGGTIAPSSVGTIESLAVNATTTIAGTFACDIAAAATDQLLVAGDLVLSGSTLTVNPITPGTGGTYVIATYTGTRSGTLGGTLPAGYSVNYDDANKEVELVVIGSAYVTWGGPFGLGAGTEGGDLDNDGLTNFEEFAFGLIPDSGSSVNPITSPLDKTSGQFTYQRLAASGLTYSIWISNNLATWTEDETALESATTVGANQSVLVTLSATPKPLTATRLFVRVIAQ